MESQIKSGQLNGAINNTDSAIRVDVICLKLDYETAWALCNLLLSDSIKRSLALESGQVPGMLSLGSVIGQLIDHPSAKNCVKK